MTLRQMTFDKISLLPDSNVRVVLAMVNEMLRQDTINANDNSDDDIERRRAAFRDIVEMREKSPFPADFDYDKARDEALTQKYGRFD